MSDEQAIFLEGNLSDGFKAWGPYETLEEAFRIHSFAEGWMFTLEGKMSKQQEE